MTATYDRLGIKFAFPENWELTQDEDPALPRAISLYSPCGAFWSATIHHLDEDPYQLADQLAKTISAEYEDVESLRYETAIVDYPISEGFELHFYCLDLLVVSRVLVLEANDYVIALIYQGESRDFDKLAQVFDAISFSMLQNLSAD